ncbi:MAG TPA: hypothetical protein VFA70_10005, partial [Dehalococcoidia bacterium]|nr:hypothetical protein [Dehalococcoidia bacterium]
TAPPPLSGVRPELPAGVSEAIAAALSKDPGKRPASARVFVDALRRAAQAPAEGSSERAAGNEPAARLAGHGDATRTVMLQPGVRCFQLSHRVWGGRPFRVTLLDAAGGSPDVLVATTGPYSGIAWRRIGEGGSYTLRIEAAGEWTVGVR